MNYSDIVEKRRSINFFDPEKAVSDEDLNTMITLASKAPSSFNLQPWNLMILKDNASKEKLKPLAWDQPKVVEAPVVLILLADRNGWMEGHDTVEKNWKQMISTGSMVPEQREWFLNAATNLYGRDPEASLAFAAKNTGFFAMALMYGATSIGLETHPMDGFDHDGVKQAFNIPDNYWVPLLLAVGYPAPGLELHAPKWRKSFQEIVVSFD